MFSYYKSSVKNGIYIACRGITDTWDRFSAGGDGAYQILPRMADRFAAGNMSSGHPNGISLLYPDNDISAESYVLKDPMKFAKVCEKILYDFISVLGNSNESDGEKISSVSYRSLTDDNFNKKITNVVTEKLCDLGTRADARTVDSFYWLEADISVNEGIIKASIDKRKNTIRVVSL